MKPPKPKTDNRSLRNKIALRRWLLDQMQLRDVSVLDTCAGEGHIWTAMQDHVRVRQWVRTDVKARHPGTLKLTALQAVTTFDITGFNVIDIDPYGEPWEPYLALLPRLRQPTAIFLTRGRVEYTVASNAALEACGIPAGWKVPHSPRLATYLDNCVLSLTWQHATILHASSVDLRNVSYYALGLSPIAS